MFENDLKKNSCKMTSKLLGFDKIDPIAFSIKYFKENLPDLSIDPNGNISGISPNNYLSEIGKPAAKKYFFKKLYERGKEINPDFSLDLIYDGTVYIHDATKLQPYCFGLSATEIATLGRPYSTLIALPPKRFESFMGQLTEFVMDCSQEFAGAIAITDLVPWMAWFIEKDSRIYDKKNDNDIKFNIVGGRYFDVYSDKEIENQFQSFVHVLNNSFRVGGDSPFTNISINSKMVYYDIFDHYIFPDGKTIDDLWPTIKRVQKIIIDFMGKGRPDGLPYKFPILTANFKADKKEMESGWFRYVAEKNYKGFMNLNFAERFAMCCRLNLDFDFKQNSFGGGGVKVGSMRVANLNLPRLAYKAKKKDPYYSYEVMMDLIEETTERAMEYLYAYSKIFKHLIDIGYLKFFREPSLWFNMNMFFATVGFCGLPDAVEILGYDPTSEDGISMMKTIVDLLVKKTKSASNGIKYNVEEVPSESAAGTMAKFNKDFGEEKEYYSNQFIPLSYDIPLDKRIKIESELQSRLTGGGMTFINFDAEITPEQSYEIHKYMMDEGFIGQFCINYGHSHCPKCHMSTIGEVKKCNICGGKTDFYTRVVGYLAKREDTAESKRIEISERKYYNNI